MHRASPTLLLAAACLAGSVLTAPSAHAEDTPTPGPVLLTPTPTAEAGEDPTTPPAEDPTATEPSAEPAAEPAAAPAAPGREGDTLVTVSVAMAATTPARPTSVRLPRAHLPLRLGHYGTRVSVVQQRLAWLGYDIVASNLSRQAFGRSTRAAVRAFQAKNWLPANGRVTKKTWAKLRRLAEPVGVLPLRCTEVKKSLCIDKTTRTLRLVVDGRVKLVTDARFGAPGMETGEGTFTVHEKSFNHVSSRYDTWMPRAMFFNGDEAVHYSPDFAAVGYIRGSHGCVGVRDLDVATELFDRVPVGTRVYVYWS